MAAATNPALYQINTRVWLTELGRGRGRPATLDDIPETELDRFAQMGFDWLWFLSVWQTGPAGGQVSRSRPDWRKEFQEVLPDLRDEDIAGSGFAITGYSVPPGLGGDPALARLRQRLRRRGLRLMLDFVPNHTGLDHPWVQAHPEYYVAGSAADLARAPQNYVRVQSPRGELILAHGRDPYFDGWPDSLQLDYSNPATQEAMLAELVKVAGQCDGVRCDMAMLLLPEVFERTWGRRAEPFWPRAIQRVRAQFPEFCFLAEVYWDLEWTLLEQGFDFAYDKRLYDRLRTGQARPVREHLQAGLDYQRHLARFLENHDEPRAAAVFPAGMHEAAATITFLTPGLRFFHQGQFEGRRKRIPVHLIRAPEEPADPVLRRFYEDLLAVLRRPEAREGEWRLLECVPAWEGNGSHDALIAFAWQDAGGERLLVAVNYAAHPTQGYVRLPFPGLGGRRWRLQDLLSEARYERDGNDLAARGLYLDVVPWQQHAFALLAE
ncbi:MAG TPA: alpha-amylase family glycosyl hydrolase [Terriglobales bacterium]|nr:alpha-amylase family glycosyl hydrolase [Terriglobales bacterium]